MEGPTTKVCRKCGEEKHIDQFRRILNSPDGHTHICISCISHKRAKRQDVIGLNSRLPKGSNPALAEFTPRELIEELRSRGFKGELQYVHIVKV